MTFDFGTSTIMSILVGVSQDDPVKRRQQLERFARQYTQPLVQFLCKSKRITPEQAAEIVQDFWLLKLIQPSADQSIAAKYIDMINSGSVAKEGSFRRFLMRSISNHYIDQTRRNKKSPLSLEDIDHSEWYSEQEYGLFDATWANSVLRSCVDAVHEEFLSNGQLAMWQLFCLQVVKPKLRGTPPPGYATLAERFAFKDASSAAYAVRKIIRKFQEQLRTQVLDYLPVSFTEDSTQSIEQECSELLLLLSKPGALDGKLFEDILGDLDSSQMSSSEFSVSSERDQQTSFLQDPTRSLYATDEDFRFRWRQLLGTSIAQWLASHFSVSDSIPPFKFFDLVRGEKLSVELLTWVRNTAKLLARDDHDEPQAILATLYMVSIANGEKNHATLLTSDPVGKVMQRIDRVLSYSWLDQDSIDILSGFRSRLLK